jgi:hypothetical protein
MGLSRARRALELAVLLGASLLPGCKTDCGEAADSIRACMDEDHGWQATDLQQLDAVADRMDSSCSSSPFHECCTCAEAECLLKYSDDCTVLNAKLRDCYDGAHHDCP